MNIKDKIAIVEKLLADAETASGTFSDDPQNWHAQHRHEMDKVGQRLRDEHGASINDRWDNTTIRLAGIRSSSTRGLAQACRNWMLAAKKRLATSEAG